MNKNNMLLRLSLTLCIITVSVAALLAVVNNITAPIIADREEDALNESLATLFPDVTYTEKEISETAKTNGVTAVYAAGDVGYCVNLLTKGYGGDINLLIGIGNDGKIKGIEVISASETPGIGTKVVNSSYLSSYTGLSGALMFSDSLKPVTGATISSKAVLAGVNKAISTVEEMKVNG